MNNSMRSPTTTAVGDSDWNSPQTASSLSANSLSANSLSANSLSANSLYYAIISSALFPLLAISALTLLDCT